MTPRATPVEAEEQASVTPDSEHSSPEPVEPGAAEPPAPSTPEPAQKPAPGHSGPDSQASKGEPQGPLAGIVAAHNQYRQAHCAPPLVWSPMLARVAQTWANRLRDQGCAFEHNPDTPYGENLAFYSPPGSTDAARVVKGWYSEIEKYDFKKGKFSFEAGHFTQVVWVRSTEIGCGMAQCKNAEIWVCNYNPPGNYQRQFSANVLPRTCR